nr:ATP-binding protein [Nocardiopsis sp. CNT312]
MVYSLVLAAQYQEHLARPWLVWTVLVAMGAWTALTVYAYARPRWRTGPFVAADLGAAFACLFVTAAAVSPFYLSQAPPLSGYWFAGAALSAGIVWRRRGAVTVALLYGCADIVLRSSMGAPVTSATARGVVLLLLAGLAVGYMAGVAERAEHRFARAVALEARIRERERLARSIHDSVLQVLSLVSRRGAEAGGEAAELGRMAGEQEMRLRTLIGGGLPDGPGPPRPEEGTDLREGLRRMESVHVSVAAPATPVLLPAPAAAGLTAAASAALDNVARHCPEGTPVWVLLEDEGDAVTVSVRDEGPGIPPGRLEEARREGRLGVAQSLQGRLRDLGGTAEVTSLPGEGTEVELRLPRRHP